MSRLDALIEIMSEKTAGTAIHPRRWVASDTET